MNENTMPNTTVDDDDVEIDLGELFQVILHRIWIIILVAVVCAAASYAVSAFVLPEEFESTTQIYVLTRADGDRGTVTTSDLQAGTQLTKDYAAIITSRYVLERVISNLNLDTTYEDLSKQVEVTTPTDTRIISITVTDTDPAMAQKIADEIRTEASTHIQNVMDIDAVNVVEEANYPTEKSAPHNTRNAAIGGLIGLVAAIVVVVIRYISDDTIKTQEDVEKYLGLSVLALIPLDEEISRNSVEETSSKKGRRRQGGKTQNKPGTRAGLPETVSEEHHHARHANAATNETAGVQRNVGRAETTAASQRDNRRRSGQGATASALNKRQTDSAAFAPDSESEGYTTRTARNQTNNRPDKPERPSGDTVSDETSVINLEEL